MSFEPSHQFQRILHNGNRNETLSNGIHTSKYTIYSFIPYFLYEQFRKLANVYFLFISCLQLIPGLSPTGRYTTLFPLCVVLIFSGIKEIYEDLRRHRDDQRENNRTTLRKITNNEVIEIKWKDVAVGDHLIIKKEETIPCDGIVISSSNKNGELFVETSQLDGETNLKSKYCCSIFKESKELDEKIDIYYNDPSLELTKFEGMVVNKFNDVERLNEKQCLLRGSKLKRVDEIEMICLYVGSETKQILNGKDATLKRSRMELQTNKLVLVMFTLAIILSSISTIGFFKWNWEFELWYLNDDGTNDKLSYFWIFFTFIILYNNLVPISLYVCLEIIKLIQAFFIENDEDIKHSVNARCRNTNLVEELGTVKFIFADKTGTLTKNEMRFKKCFIDGNEFTTSFSFDNANQKEQWFLRCLSTCHTADKTDKGYSASSADEEILVNVAKEFGIEFKERTSEEIITSEGIFKYYIIPFSSERKRMSVVLIQNDKGWIFMKGANGIVQRNCQDKNEKIEKKCKEYAEEGLRILVIAGRELKKEEIQNINKINETGKMESLEKELIILGCTAVEDELQEGVIESIEILKKAGIVISMLTGDMKETAITIARNAHILSKKEEENEFIISGKEMSLMLKNNKEEIIKKIISSSGVCVYRCTPNDKSNVVNVINNYLHQQETMISTLSIGDGCNDVSMIRTANVGIGITGKEGMSAARAADFSIEKFRDIVKLLLVHGRYSFNRIGIFTSHTLYRSILLFITQFYFAFFSGFSGTSIYERWSLVMFNILFSILLPMVVATFDKDYSSYELISRPELYLTVNSIYTLKTVLLWFTDGVIESMIIFFCGKYLLSGDIGFGEIGMDGLGFTIYGAIVIVSCFHLATHSHTFVWPFYISMILSILLFFGWYVFYGFVGGFKFISMGESVYMLAFNLCSLPRFWIVLLYIICVPLVKPTFLRCLEDIKKQNEEIKFLNAQIMTLFMKISSQFYKVKED
ncbi:phospholipid-transporting P-type ATPase, putative [Entamoeba histolytica KU27]|uniref:Phospholipid-transporting P-type ATPase, putative n=1 Tax=Entamoeba histolytica KU27 TaxID=885311 RepID=M2S121_ENTHI|nr:phospholipid-transporting P-type ATPase, putative [Entamoeba histolytica KU27]